jgi:hypothetical protein
VGRHFTIPLVVVSALGAIGGAYIGFRLGGVGAAILGMIVVSASGAFLGLLIGAGIEALGDGWRRLSANNHGGLIALLAVVGVLAAIVLLWDVGH